MKKRLLVLVVLAGLLLGGCMSRELANINYYQLEIPHQEKQCKEVLTYQWLGVMAESKNRSKQIPYTKSANQIEFFSKNQWVGNFPDLLDLLAIKIAKNHCIALIKNQNISNTLWLYVLDLHYDESTDSVVFEAVLEQNKKGKIEQLWILETKEVAKGGFEEIIKAMNESIAKGISQAFAKVE